MIEIHADMWRLPADLHVITTNGDVRGDGNAVMGRGCALQAALAFDRVAVTLGTDLKMYGNHVHDLGLYKMSDGSSYHLASFPVKHHWMESANLKLIKQSVWELLGLVDRLEARTIVLVRPGCGNGRLKWETVKPYLKPLDDRFLVVTND